MAATIRERQTAALKRMLNLSVPLNKSSSVEPVWKILIYDRCGQDIISPLLSVRELREMGVTLHLLLHSDRDAIPDVPAVYFILPTEENIQRITQDFRNQLYDSYFLNFISPISRQKLEDLASAALQSNCVSHITKVFDQYLNFITLEDDMFILRHQNCETMSYYSINRGDMKDTEMYTIMDSIVECLFSFFVTLGTVPIIRSPRGNAAEKLDKKLRENLRDSRNSLFTTDTIQSGQFSFQRPLFVVLDRNLDLATPLHHSWTYQALAHDVLDLKINRVTLEEGLEKSSHAGAKPRTKTKTFDLQSMDKFWIHQKGSPFPIVAEAVQGELESYRAQEDEVKRLKSAMGLNGESDEAISMLSDNTAKLTSAVSSLPELLEKKRLMDMHTTVATAILDQIKSRKLDVFFEIEEKIQSKTTLDKSLIELFADPEAGTPEDKMRLFLIYYICGPTLTDAEVDQYAAVLKDSGCDLAPLNFTKRWKIYSKLPLASNQYTGGGTKTISMFSKLMSQGSQFVMEGVKNFVVKKHNLPVTRIVDSLMEMKSLQETDDYRYFDPKLLRVTDSSSIPRSRSPFQEAIVFIVGGGNYIEYQNLVDYARNKSGGNAKRIVYGCTNLQSPNQFLKQIDQLGKEI
uniref:Protein sly1 homolog n=1 Tax=Strigamia maritima TaxID=126957 RepID=T1JGN0_STRMM